MMNMLAVYKPSVTKKPSKSVAPKQAKPSLHSCNHRFIHLETKKIDEIVIDEQNNHYYTHYKRIDIFYCEKCLEYKTKVLEKVSQETPDWF